MKKPVTLSQTEADRLLNMLKRSLVSKVNFPLKREDVEFNVIGEEKQDVFAINIFRGKLNHLRYNIGARIIKNDVMLLELHINPSNAHINPDGEKIKGSHWHIYREGYGRLWAFPAEDINSELFIENTITFLNRFHVIEQPAIHQQIELI